MDIKIEGNPGTGNTFQEIHIGSVGTYNNESNNQDGFEEVVKHKVRPRKNEDPDNNQFPKQKEFHKKKIHVKEENPPRKRQYDKKSGTGRGREISKGGAGGKGTWGNNPKDMARKYEKNYDDYYIDAALHPEENENKNEEQENKEEKDNNENKKEENNNNENNENKENKKR